MRLRGTWKLAGLALTCLLVLGLHADASAQGRGGSVGRPPGAELERGGGTASDSSRGRADTGLGTASLTSSGRTDAGRERARRRHDNASRADAELREHPEMAGLLHTTAGDLREGYRAALAANPDLKFGQYVAATRLAANLGARHPNVTREAILAGLAGGHGLGQTLRNLGVGRDEAKEAVRQAERELKQSERHDH
ncbi:MAG TPA: hypothetical protein VF538_03130 [Pyrinomonadaceae bacterium]